MKKVTYKRNTARNETGIDGLVQRLDLFFGDKASRMVTFIAARPKEGTSTVARNFADKLAEETLTRVLFLSVNATTRTLEPEIITSALAHNKSRTVEERLLEDASDMATQMGSQNLVALPPLFEQWTKRTDGSNVPSKLLLNSQFRESLCESFDTVVIDAPALQTSSEGLSYAARSDAVVIVVEASSTREAVVENLRDTLDASGAKIAGLVLNKRRLYIPEKVYARL